MMMMMGRNTNLSLSTNSCVNVFTYVQSFHGVSLCDEGNELLHISISIAYMPHMGSFGRMANTDPYGPMWPPWSGPTSNIGPYGHHGPWATWALLAQWAYMCRFGPWAPWAHIGALDHMGQFGPMCPYIWATFGPMGRVGPYAPYWPMCPHGPHLSLIQL